MSAPGLLSVRRWQAIGTRCEVLAESEELAEAAATIIRGQLAELDAACSRFRPSELSRLSHGRMVSISPILSDAIAAALRTAQRTQGLVDPTICRALETLGYDADIAQVRGRHLPSPLGEPVGAPGYWRVFHEEGTCQVMVPRGVDLDLGASAKAWAADRAARSCRDTLGGSYLVNLGGDLAVAGPGPAGGWRVAIDDASGPGGGGSEVDRPVVTIRSGGLATSSTALRTWWSGERRVHHILDPRTGDAAAPIWRTVSVTAATCERANAAATAAIILGAEAPEWLARRGLSARLVNQEGMAVFVSRWPEDRKPMMARSA
ncbi:FAD:protein FMN transferase [Microlunatus panaciterrae]|uniref:FAD:protein FMN transferase n=1 Tax=Microlunatus panaciterrae TaxID=400768 RepID=A0ABS2RGH3_9ACTN|nr:FAD:protein FMN transferase [Microlunatus panaciterrae]MBM7798104.1 thiamine biosynthesis lipoprotein [Microlunatus panaciterrae]